MVNSDLVVARAEQDQLWMELDEWYNKSCEDEELIDLVETVSLPPIKSNLKKIRLQNVHGLEILRMLALHTLRELVLRQQLGTDDETAD